MKTVLSLALLLAGCSNSVKDVVGRPVDPLPISERAASKFSMFFCSTESLQKRFAGTLEKGKQPSKGSIAIFDTRKWTDGHAAVFRVNRLDAAAVVECFDDWESHAPEVVYKSTGEYPVYFQHVTKGGCERGEVNCAD